jgi:hypothetical protein
MYALPMNFPDSKHHVGNATALDGQEYHLHFYGENEGAAVMTGPTDASTGELKEVHREDAKDAPEAYAKLAAWAKGKGWVVQSML